MIRGDEGSCTPTAERTALRALVLARLSWRAFFEGVEPGDAGWVRSGVAWLARDELRAEAEPAEARLLAAPRGWLDGSRPSNVSWGIEAAALFV